MQKLRRWAAAALCGAAFAGSAAAALAACAVCPGRAWIVRGALFLPGPCGGCGHRLASGCRPGRLQAPEAGPPPHAVPTATPSPAPTAAATPTPEPSPASTPLPSAAPELDDAGLHPQRDAQAGQRPTAMWHWPQAASEISTEHTDADLLRRCDDAKFTVCR